MNGWLSVAIIIVAQIPSSMSAKPMSAAFSNAARNGAANFPAVVFPLVVGVKARPTESIQSLTFLLLQHHRPGQSAPSISRANFGAAHATVI
jgi:hypothetical protein